MARWHLHSERKPSGGRHNISRKKRRTDKGSEFVEPTIGERWAKKKRCRGGNIKTKVREDSFANVADGDKITKTKITGVASNPANPLFTRRNVLTKGAIIKTELGEAKIVSRPTQHGVINAVLLKKK